MVLVWAIVEELLRPRAFIHQTAPRHRQIVVLCDRPDGQAARWAGRGPVVRGVVRDGRGWSVTRRKRRGDGLGWPSLCPMLDSSSLT